MNAIINKDSIGIYLNGAIRTVKSDNPCFDRIKQAIKEDDLATVETLIDKSSAINEFGEGVITVKNGEVFYKDIVLNNHLTQRLTSLMREGFGVSNLTKFIENLYLNPSKRAVDELYKFLEHRALPITEDGCFLAYKAITNDWKDIYTRTVDNSIGAKPSMPRKMVDEDKARHCSQGLHVGAMGYVKQYGDITRKPVTGQGNRVVIVKVNPKDAVSVPEDHGCQKLRVSDYEVIAELSDYDKVLEKAVYTADAQEKTADSKTFATEKPTETKEVVGESDSVFFDGRRDGELDAESGIPYEEPVGKSKKYIRGYKNGYRRSGIKF